MDRGSPSGNGDPKRLRRWFWTQVHAKGVLVVAFHGTPHGQAGKRQELMEMAHDHHVHRLVGRHLTHSLAMLSQHQRTECGGDAAASVKLVAMRDEIPVAQDPDVLIH